MKRIFGILLASSIWSLSGISLPTNTPAIAQTQENSDLFYLYKGQRIPLNQRPDAIAVAFKKQDLRNCHKRWRGYAAPRAQQLEDKHGNQDLRNWHSAIATL